MSYQYDGNGTFHHSDDRSSPRSAAPPKSTARKTSTTQKSSASRSKNANKSDNDFGAWAFIGFMFAVAWPVGLIMLIAKLSQSGGRKKKRTSSRKKTAVNSAAGAVTRTPKDSAQTARRLKIVGAVLAVLGAMAALGVLGDLSFYVDYGGLWWLLEDLFPCAGLLAAGGSLLLGGRAMTRRMRRFAKYLAAAGSSQSVSIARLASTAEVSVRRVENDLEIMVDKGMWGEGAYVDLSAGKLFRSASAAEADYAQKSASAGEAVTQEEQGYFGMLRQIRLANDRIEDEVLSAKMDRLEEITGHILRLIEEQPEKKAQAGTFLNYYLPTTLKLLESYADFDEAGVSGGNLSQAKYKIEQTMDNIVQGFERQLDELYRDDALDIDSDIRVMESMLRRDGSRVEDDFGLSGSNAAACAAEPQDEQF